MWRRRVKTYEMQVLYKNDSNKLGASVRLLKIQKKRVKMKYLIILLLIFSSACSSRKKLESVSNKVEAKDAIRLWANWVKDKGKKYDVQLAIENIHKSDIIIYLKDIRCFRGNSSGQFKHTFFNTGERTIDFVIDEVKEFNLVCRLNAEGEKGPYKIVIEKVYSNPSQDGKSRGEVIAENIQWSVQL